MTIPKELQPEKFKGTVHLNKEVLQAAKIRAATMDMRITNFVEQAIIEKLERDITVPGSDRANDFRYKQAGEGKTG